MRVSSTLLSIAISSKVGFQSLSASSMACVSFSSSVRRTVALLVSPEARAASMAFLTDKRCDRRWIMGHRSVDRPRRVSTALNAELGMEVVEKVG